VAQLGGRFHGMEEVIGPKVKQKIYDLVDIAFC
jgi:hypothetical protein